MSYRIWNLMSYLTEMFFSLLIAIPRVRRDGFFSSLLLCSTHWTGIYCFLWKSKTQLFCISPSLPSSLLFIWSSLGTHDYFLLVQIKFILLEAKRQRSVLTPIIECLITSWVTSRNIPLTRSNQVYKVYRKRSKMPYGDLPMGREKS